jgi:hypothetical protein
LGRSPHAESRRTSTPLESDSVLAACGAQAAAAGLPWYSNPYLRQDHAPRATGESVCEWARKHDAWQRGFEGYGCAPPPRD